MNQIDIPNYQCYLGCNAEKNDPSNVPGKKLVFHTEVRD